jgi:hypothetical protein
LTRIFVDNVLAFYARSAAVPGSKTGAVTVVQRTASDLRVNPHLHVVFLDGVYCERGETLKWLELGHIRTGEVGDVLERAVRSMLRHLRRRGALEPAGAELDLARDEQDDAADVLVASAVSGQVPPAGPQWCRGLAALEPHPLSYDKHLCASKDGFTLHAATRAGRLKLLAMVTEPRSVRRYLVRIGESTDLPPRSPSRGPPFWKSVVLRLRSLEQNST